MRLIVNADDFGFHENANRAIAACFAEGTISQTTAMMNMPAIESALALAREKGFHDCVGLHVNLSEGCPLSDGIRKSRLFCDANGLFNGIIRTNKFLRFHLPRSERRVVMDEIRAQMRAFIDAGLPMRHFDSHGHVHAYISLMPLFLQCAKEYGFRSTRIFIDLSANHYGDEVSFLRRCYINCGKRMIDKAGLMRTTHLGLAHDVDRHIDELEDDSVTEVLCHPQYRLPDNTISMEGRLVDWKTPYEESVGLLKKCRNRFQLVTFEDLR